MKKRYLFFGALLLSSFGLQAQQHLNDCYKGDNYWLSLNCNDDPYILIFEDNFDGNSLDLNNWELRAERGSIGDVQEYNTLENVSLANGKASINARNEVLWAKAIDWEDPALVLSDGRSNYRKFDYTSSNLWSKFIFDQGYFEISCTLPAVSRYWPAFWLLSSLKPPQSSVIHNELDIMEMMSDNPFQNSMTLHGGGNLQCGDKVFGPNSSDGLHTFGALWDDWHIVWYIDHHPVQTTYKWYVPLPPGSPPTAPSFGITCEGAEAYGSEFNAVLNEVFPTLPMRIIFNLAVRIDASPYEDKSMVVDYIRYYQQRPNCGTPNNYVYTSRASLGLDNDPANMWTPWYHHVTGSVVTALGNITLTANDQLKLTAAEEFNFDLDANGLPVPNSSIVFDVQPGANFEAVIDPYICSNNPILLPTNNVIHEAPDHKTEGSANGTGTLGFDAKVLKTERIAVSPNPSNQDVITVMSPEATKVIISNAQGIKVKEAELETGSNKLNIQDLSSGVYNLYFESLKSVVKWVKL